MSKFSTHPSLPNNCLAYFLNMSSHCNVGLIAEAMSWAGGGCQQSTHHQETMLELVENYPDNYVSWCFTMEHKSVVSKIQGKLSKSTCFSCLYVLPPYTVYIYIYIINVHEHHRGHNQWSPKKSWSKTSILSDSHCNLLAQTWLITFSDVTQWLHCG